MTLPDLLPVAQRRGEEEEDVPLPSQCESLGGAGGLLGRLRRRDYPWGEGECDGWSAGGEEVLRPPREGCSHPGPLAQGLAAGASRQHPVQRRPGCRLPRPWVSPDEAGLGESPVHQDDCHQWC